MSDHPNVAILLTPAGTAAIAVVRIVGPAVSGFLDAHFNRPVSPEHCVHGEIRDGEVVLDDAVVVVSADRQRADLNLHAGPWVVRSVLTLVAEAGFTCTDRTTFPLPEAACDGDTPLQRQIVASLPLAATELAVKTLLSQETSWIGAAGMSADERLEMIADKELWSLLHPPRVAIAGAPNVGKSTLANALFAQERSITADLPGTTRDWVGETANLDGLPVTLMDTPGIRATTDPIEAAAIDLAAGELATADLVVLVLDPARPMATDQLSLVDRFPGALRVVNKIDLPPLWDPEGIHMSATVGAGVDLLRTAVRRFFQLGVRPGKPKWWTLQQRDSLATGGSGIGS